MIASISDVSAFNMSISGGKAEVTGDNSIVNLNAANCDVRTNSRNVTYLQVIRGKRFNVQAVGRGSDGSALTVNRAAWNFGDSRNVKRGTKQNHRYTKTGWYTITLTMNASGRANLMGMDLNTTWRNSQRTFLIKVVNGADLTATNFQRLSNNRRSRDSTHLAITLRNVGNRNSLGWTRNRPALIRVSYLAKDKNRELRTFTKTARLPSIRAGRTQTIRVNFRIPHRLRNHVKVLEIDFRNRARQGRTGNNVVRFR